MNKAFETYNGGKGSDGTFQKIINLMPPHDLYIEPFLGNGAIFRKKKPSQYSILIDIDTAVTQAWKKIALPAGTTILNTDAISFLKHFRVLSSLLKNTGNRCVIYIDPPYPMGARKSDRNIYSFEMSDEQHIELLTVARSLMPEVSLIISSYPNEIYDKILHDFQMLEFQSQTRSGLATEKVYFNFPIPEVLHDYRYLGDNYRERELIKGRIYRNVSKLKQMPAAEFNAIMEELGR